MHCGFTDVKSIFRQRFFADMLQTMAPTDTIPPSEEPTNQQQPSVVAVEELGRLIREYRGRQSIRQAAAEAGVSFSTLSRVEAGAQPDLATFLRLCAWLEVPPERFFRNGAQRPTDTLDAVSGHLFADPKLSPDAAERIAHVVRDLYLALAQEGHDPEPLALHLRATNTMRPGVPERLGSLLHDMRSALEERLADGSL
jgi:transcriptional regulator with XRE-family HTH domain